MHTTNQLTGKVFGALCSQLHRKPNGYAANALKWWVKYAICMASDPKRKSNRTMTIVRGDVKKRQKQCVREWKWLPVSIPIISWVYRIIRTTTDDNAAQITASDYKVSFQREYCCGDMCVRCTSTLQMNGTNKGHCNLLGEKKRWGANVKTKRT